MNILIIGGRLQGSEVAYLAKEAGWNVSIVDRTSDVLAAELGDQFVCGDATTWDPCDFAPFDLVIPATENLETLLAVQRICNEAGVPFAFDEVAFKVSASKQATNTFLTQIGIPIPPSVKDAHDWPYGYVVKPDSESGSHGVRRFERREDAALFLLDHERYVGQAFVEGPIYSIEVTCNGYDVHPHVVTEVVVGEDFDCYRIVAPADIPAANERWIKLIAQRIGLALSMRGIFDIELVWCDDEPFVLEIDARMPSQTPIAIYHATGLNLVVELARCFTDTPADSASEPDGKQTQRTFPGHSVFEHICIDQRDADAFLALEAATCSSPDALARAGIQTIDEFVSLALARYVGESELSDGLPYKKVKGFCGTKTTLLAWDRSRSRLFATLVF